MGWCGSRWGRAGSCFSKQKLHQVGHMYKRVWGRFDHISRWVGAGLGLAKPAPTPTPCHPMCKGYVKYFYIKVANMKRRAADKINI